LGIFGGVAAPQKIAHKKTSSIKELVKAPQIARL
jgi:hypothetical protein